MSHLFIMGSFFISLNIAIRQLYNFLSSQKNVLSNPNTKFFLEFNRIPGEAFAEIKYSILFFNQIFLDNGESLFLNDSHPMISNLIRCVAKETFKYYVTPEVVRSKVI